MCVRSCLNDIVKPRVVVFHQIGQGIAFQIIINQLAEPLPHRVSAAVHHAGARLMRFAEAGDGRKLAFRDFQNFADGKLIRGACIGTPSAENGKTWDCTKVYDGSKHTYFAAQDADTSWVGLQLAIPVRVSRICYIPRNDDNFVKPGDLYELLVWDRGQWYTMGRQVPDTYGLDYEGVPAGHLYWLRDLTEGVEERIFTYEQGKQVWW